MLKVWIPGTTDFKDQGLNGTTITNTGVTIDTAGKLGGCLYFNNTGNLVGSPGPLSNSTSDWTFACWMKGASFSNSGCLFSERTAVASTGITIFNGSSWYIDDGARWTITPTTTISVNKWYHICIVRKGGVGKYFYINGVLDSSTVTTGTASSVNTQSFVIGSSQQSSSTVSGNQFNGYLNDIRIYDNALSPREIAEIAKGLILHYPLAKPGVDNLLTGTDVPFSYAESSDYRKVAGSKTYPLGIDAKELLLTAGERGLTLSYDICIPKIYISSSDTLKRAGAYLPITVKNKSTQQSLGAYYGHHTQTGTATATNNYAKTNSLNPINASSTADNPDTTFNGHYSRTIYPRQFSNLSAFFADPDSYDVTCSGYTVEIRGGYIKDECSISNVKLEFGDVATPWTPNPADSIYTSMGFDDGIEYDVSGFKNNGVISNSSLIETSANTPRYNTNFIFKRSSNSNSLSTIGYITKENFYMPDEFTISYWWYFDDSLKLINNPPSVFGYGSPGGYSTNGLHNYDNLLSMNFAEFGSDTKSVSQSVQVPSPIGVWHHRCFVFNGNKVFNYYNGALSSSVDINTTTKMHVVRSNQILTIGYDQAGGLIRGVSGGLSDFRIYATALSADDILALYNTPLSLSSNGVLLTQGEYTEV